MVDQDMNRQIREAFDSAQGSGAADSPCAIYLASAGNASSLGDAIESHFGGAAKAFYDALVQIAVANCNGGGGSAR